MGLGIDTLMWGELDWMAHWEGPVDADGYFSYALESQENLVAMSARATAAAAGQLLDQSSDLALGAIMYPSELISARSSHQQGMGAAYDLQSPD